MFGEKNLKGFCSKDRNSLPYQINCLIILKSLKAQLKLEQKLIQMCCLQKGKILFRGHMLLVILKLQKLLERSTKDKSNGI